MHNPEQYEGKDFEWCPEHAETIAHSVDDEEYTVEHECRLGEGHAGPHRCVQCPTAWEGAEVPC